MQRGGERGSKTERVRQGDGEGEVKELARARVGTDPDSAGTVGGEDSARGLTLQPGGRGPFSGTQRGLGRPRAERPRPSAVQTANCFPQGPTGPTLTKRLLGHPGRRSTRRLGTRAWRRQHGRPAMAVPLRAGVTSASLPLLCVEGVIERRKPAPEHLLIRSHKEGRERPATEEEALSTVRVSS